MEENEQAELTSHIPRKYKLTAPLRTYATQEPYPDINGAESQWSTKLLPATTLNKLFPEKSEEEKTSELSETTETVTASSAVEDSKYDRPSEVVKSENSQFGDKANTLNEFGSSGNDTTTATTEDVSLKNIDVESNQPKVVADDAATGIDRPKIMKVSYGGDDTVI